jgi:hypothetical protein
VACGSEEAVTDANGVKWSADTGSEDGSTISRPELAVAGTKTPQIFQAERYGMSAYSFKVPNGKYKLNLYFSEGYEGNTEPDSRLFDYAIKDGDAAKGKVIQEFQPVEGFRRRRQGVCRLERCDGDARSDHHHVQPDCRESADQRDRNHPPVSVDTPE